MTTTTEATEATEDAARILLDAFTERRAIESLPDHLTPVDVDAGYAIQHAGHRLSNAPLGPWKAGATSVLAQQFLGVEAPFIGRPHVDRVLATGSDISLGDWFVGPAGIEVEIGLVPHVDLTDIPDDPLDFATLVDAVGCFELVNSRFTDMALPGAPSLIADNAVASAIVAGPSLGFDANGIRALDQLVVALDVDGVELVAATGASALGHPLDVLHVVAGRALEWGTPIAAGELVITGTCTGLVPPVAGSSVRGRFGNAQIAMSFRA